MYFLSFRILSNLRLSWKTECALNSLYWLYIFYHSEFWTTCAYPEKQSLPWNFSLYWNIFYLSEFLSNLSLPWKQSLPSIFQAGGAAAPPRLVRHWVNDLLRSLPNCKSFNCLCLRNRLLLIHVTFAVHPTAWLTLPNHKQHSVFDIDTGVSVQHWLNMFYFTDMGTFFAWWSHTNTLMTGRSIRFTVADSQIHILKNRSNGIFHNWT